MTYKDAEKQELEIIMPIPAYCLIQAKRASAAVSL